MTGPILIQGAMEVETDWLVSRLEATQALTRGVYRFWAGTYGGLELVISRTGIGTISAACATALGIQRFKPAVVINQGLAGGHREDLRVGDIVVGESCIHIHDLSTPRRGRGEGSDPFGWSFHIHEEDGRYPVYAADPRWAVRFEQAGHDGGAKCAGRLGSGDVFNREADRILWLRERCGALCEDMESVGTYQVCAQLGVPCVGLRIISNNELTGEPYKRTVGEKLQKFVLDTLTEGT